MKRYLLMVLAIMFMAIGGQAYAASPGHKFCEAPLSDPQDLARKIEASLASDPSGNGRIVGCRAKPIDFFHAWRDEPTGMKKVGDLPAFIRSLEVIEVNRSMKYRSSCVRQDGNGIVRHCVERLFHAGEKGWGKDGQVFLKGDCTNPIHLAVEEVVAVADPCIRVEFPSAHEGQAIRIAYIDRKGLPDKCLRLVAAGGNPDGFRGIPQECPNTYKKVVNGREVTVVCVWDEVEQVASQNMGFRAEVQNVAGSFRARGAGTNVLYLPRQAKDGTVAICWEMPDGSFHTLGVRGVHYDGNVARITPAHVASARWGG